MHGNLTYRQVYDELPEFDWETYEPERSRVQIDVSKATRVNLKHLAKRQNMNIKTMTLMALWEKYPELEEVLRHEIKQSVQRRRG